MKKKMISVFAVLILCLSLFLTGALAAEGTGTTVTINDTDLEAGKFYIVNDGGGVTVMETIDNLTGYYFYLTYADGTLTLHSNGNNVCTIENVSMSVTGDLTIKGDINYFNFSMSDTFQLNGATLTLDVPSFYLWKSTNDPSPLIDNGKIVFAKKQSSGALTLENYNGVIANGALTIQNANSVELTGFTAKGGVFSNNLTVNNCSNVTITQTNPANPVIIDESQITKDANSTIKTAGTELDISRFDFNEAQAILDELEPDTPLPYKAGDGSISFQKTENNKIKMTLDNAVAEDGNLLIGTYEFGTHEPTLKDVIIEVKGDNKIATLEAQSIELTGGGSLTGALCTEGGTFTKDSFQGNLNALAISFPDSDSGAQGIVTVYGKADWSLASFGFSVRQLIVSEGATLTIPSGYTVEIPLNADGTSIPVTIEGEIVNNGTIELTGATALDNSTDANIKDIIQKLNLEGSGKVAVSVGSGDGSPQTTYYSNSGVKQLNPTNGELDLSSVVTDDIGNWDTQGYKWENITTDPNDSKITSGTLTLKEGFNATKVILPDATVEIITDGDSAIGKLIIEDENNSSPQKTKLTFSGTGELVIENRLEISGGRGNSITVADGANVIANSGITIGESGIDGIITVNGTLTATDNDWISIYAGKVEIGEKGTLNVSGMQGVNVYGMDNDNFTNVFTIAKGGKFVANCSVHNIMVTNSTDDLPDDVTPEKAIDIPANYLPAGYGMIIITIPSESEGSNPKKQIHLAHKETKKIYCTNNGNGPLTIHEHTDPGTFTPGADEHWKVCSECNSEIPNTRAAHHSSNGYTSSLSDSNDHWKICSDCQEKFDSKPHTWNQNSATCTTAKTCTVCSRVGHSALGHTASSTWEKNATNHWHVCTRCKNQMNNALHTPSDWIVDKQATTTEEGSQHKECTVCKYTIQTETIPKLDPTHTHDWKTEWNSDATHHWHECAAAGCTVTNNSQKDGYGAHIYNNAQDTTCNTCGYERTVEPVDPDKHSVTVDSTEGAGTVKVEPESAKAGTEITLTATPEEGYRFKEWEVVSGDISLSDEDKIKNPLTFVMPAENVEIKATFEKDSEEPTPPEPPAYNVTVDNSEQTGAGTVEVKPESAKAGDTVTLTATPNSGYHFKEWEVVSDNVTLTAEQKTANPLTFIMPAGDVKIKAVFEKDGVPARPSGGGGGGGSSSSGSSSSSITIEQPEHGKITSNRPSASKGTVVTLTAAPDDGYRMKSLTVTDGRNNAMQLTDQGDGKYTFTMPGAAIKVKAIFEPLPEPSKPDENDGGAAPAPSYGDYTDLEPDAWYYEAVNYVLEAGLMQGYDDATFAPNDNLSRAQLAQILYNKEGKPAATGGNGFADVAKDQWYADAVAWAAEKGIVNGYGAETFAPNDNITREQLAVMLWRYAGSPAVSTKELNFTDAEQVGDYALEALCWAVENGVLNGMGDGVLNPRGLATRAQTAQILKNFLDK